MKPNGFIIQTRIVNIAAIVLLLILTIVFYLLLPSIAVLKEKVKTNQSIPNIYRPPLPETYDNPTPLSVMPDRVQTEPTISYKPPIASQNMPIAIDEFYIQLDAFAVLQSAGKYRDKKQLKTNHKVLIAVQDNGGSPYKVLVGPFTKKQAEMLIVNKKWKGFVRSRTSFDYLLQ